MTNEQKEQLREAVLVILADRPTSRLSVTEITRRVRRAEMADGDWSEADVREAVEILSGFGFAQKVEHKLAGLYSWKATSEGVLYRERNIA